MIKMIISARLMASVTVTFAILSGCSSLRNSEPEYLKSVEGPPLEIPQGMNGPDTSRAVVITVPQMRMPGGDELEPMPPRVVSTAGKQDTNSFMAWSAEGVYLMVKDTPESVARRLKFAIENSGMNVLERHDGGAYKFHYTQIHLSESGFFSRMAFWRDGPIDYSGSFMTKLQPDGENTRVYLHFANGKEVDTAGAEHILGIFMERFG